MSLQTLFYAFFQSLAAVARKLPQPRVIAIADAFAAVVYGLYRLTPWRGFIQANLQAAYPTSEPAWRDAVARAHVRNLARCITEVMRLPLLTQDNLDAHVRFEGREHLEAAQAEGRGVVLVTGHFGNWELMGAAIALSGLPLHVLVQRPSQDVFDRLFREYRGACGVQTHLNAGAASLRPVLRALARQEALGLLVDQHGESQEAIVTLLGRPVSAPVGPLFFARRTGAAVIPIFAVRDADGRHTVHIEPELAVTGDDERDAQAYYAVIERYVRAHPDHWLWVHDRWAREHELTRSPRGQREEALA